MESWQKLLRDSVPLTSTVEMDDLTRELIRPFDYESNGVSSFSPFVLPEMPPSFNIGVIVGASGTGKSTLLQKFGKPSTPIWDTNRSIASHFENPVDANERLSAAGLMSVPEWVKPYEVLSNGQKFRADLAISLRSGAVIDEYTSVVDRNVAKAASTSMSKYIRRNNIKGVVLATVHRDILEFLEPDWVIDTDRGEWASGRYLQRPELVLDVYPCDNSIWSYFASHHYLSGKLNKASHSYLAVWEGQLVGYVASMTYPSGTVKNAWREHRLVIHPDYQGLGFGPRLSEVVAQHYLNNKKRYFSKTSHPRLGEYRDSSPLWKPTSKNHMKRKDGLVARENMRWQLNPERWSFSHEYVGTNA
jgi:GNAT superfamily N-acetyltransferase